MDHPAKQRATQSNDEPNPYAPPAPSERAPSAVEAVGPSGLSTSNLWLARLYLGGALFFLTVGGAAAGLMRAVLLDPSARSAESYARSFGLHSLAMASGVAVPALGCAVGALVVPGAMGTQSETTAKLALAGWGVWALGVIGLLAGQPVARPWWTFPAVALGIGLMAVHLVVVCALAFIRRTTRSAPRGVLFALGLGLVEWPCAERALLANSADPTVPGVGAIVWQMFPDAEVVTAASWPNLLMATVLSVHLFVRRRDHDPTASGSLVPLVYVVAGILPAALLYLVSSALVGAASVDLHLHDTYFDVGRLHAGASVAVLALLAAAHAWFEELFGRTYRQGLAVAACLTIALGTHATTFRMMQLGMQGMPRRYATYLDIFGPLHRDIGIATAITAAGAVIAIAALMTGRRLVSGSRA